MVRVLRPSGLILRPSQPGLEKTDLPLDAKFSTTIGGVGTGAKQLAYVCCLPPYFDRLLTPDQASRVSKKLGSGARLNIRLRCRWMERSLRRQSTNGGRWLSNTRKTTQNQIHSMNLSLVSTLILSLYSTNNVWEAPALDTLRRKFMQEEANARKQPDYTTLHKMTPTNFLHKALDIEEKQ